jgi:hypothetical protein
MFFNKCRDQLPVEVEQPVLKPVEIPFGIAFPVSDPLAIGQQASRLGYPSAQSFAVSRAESRRPPA